MVNGPTCPERCLHRKSNVTGRSLLLKLTFYSSVCAVLVSTSLGIHYATLQQQTPKKSSLRGLRGT